MRGDHAKVTSTPPERIDLGDLVVRRWQPDDLLPRIAAVTASYDELHAWMEWLPEPLTYEQHRAFGEDAATNWPSEGEFRYGIFATDGTLLGACGLHELTDPHTVGLGYWCHSAHTGRGVVTRAAGALTSAAMTLPQIDQVQIRCDKANVRSAAVARRLGYRLDRIVEDGIYTPAESGYSMYWLTD